MLLVADALMANGETFRNLQKVQLGDNGRLRRRLPGRAKNPEH